MSVVDDSGENQMPDSMTLEARFLAGKKGGEPRCGSPLVVTHPADSQWGKMKSIPGDR